MRPTKGRGFLVHSFEQLATAEQDHISRNAIKLLFLIQNPTDKAGQRIVLLSKQQVLDLFVSLGRKSCKNSFFQGTESVEDAREHIKEALGFCASQRPLGHQCTSH